MPAPTLPRFRPTRVAWASRWRPRTPGTPLPFTLSLPLSFPPSSQCHRHRCAVVPPPALSPRCARFLDFRNLGCTSIHFLPLWFFLSTLTGLLPRIRSTATIDPSHRCAPTAVQGSQRLPFEVTNLPCPLISPSSLSGARDSSPE
jgi:hypothetical protein